MIGVLCLVAVVLAAPHQSKAPKTHCESFICESDRMMEVTCRIQAPAKPEPAAPMMHDSSGFLYW